MVFGGCYLLYNNVQRYELVKQNSLTFHFCHCFPHIYIRESRSALSSGVFLIDGSVLYPTIPGFMFPLVPWTEDWWAAVHTQSPLE